MQTPRPTSHKGDKGQLRVEKRATAYSWGNYLGRIYRQTYVYPSHETLTSKYFHILIFTGTFVMLAEKKVKRQCSSKRFIKSKATAELPQQDQK